MVTTFKIKEEHLQLLDSAQWENSNCEFGAPAIDPKRPYGNSAVEADIAEILGWEYDYDDDDLNDQIRQLHSELVTVLEIGIELRYFEPGWYLNNGVNGWQPHDTTQT